MKISETFATRIRERIEPVVKVADRQPAVLLGELDNLVITPQWEKYLYRILDAYTDAADRENEQGIGIWISGFFGSGKSLLMKVLGMLLEGGKLQGQAVHDVFLGQLPPGSPDRSHLQRFLTISERKLSTTAVGGNLHAHLAGSGDTLALVAFKLFAAQRGYTHNWPLAWAVEHQIDARGLSDDFRRRAAELCGSPWDEVANDPEFYSDQLYAAAAAVLPDHFSGGQAAVERAVNSAVQSGITPAALIERLSRWCEARDGGGRRHKLLLQLDELGQWIAGGNPNERTMQVQALVETAAASGRGRIWIAATAHGDVQALAQNVQQEHYAKINQRFAVQCKLSNDDISQVVEERLLRKTQPARVALEDLFGQRSGELTDLGSPQGTQRVYPVPDAGRFALFYPYMPWVVASIPDVVKGIAQAAGREEALTGSNRTMIGVVQGAIIETPGLLDSQVGRMLSLAGLYDQLASDVPIETKTDLNRVPQSVPDATPLTGKIARALFLLGQAKYIPTTLENVTRALVDALDANMVAERKSVKLELERLIGAGYAKQVGDAYFFLSTQQRSFQEKVRARQDELLAQSYELSQALKEYESEDALRFERVPLQGREISLKLEMDGRALRNTSGSVVVRIYSPLQRGLDPQIGDDSALQQRSNQEADTVFFRLGEVQGLRSYLALAVATDEVAGRVSTGSQGGPEVEIARQARQVDLASHKAEVRRLLAQSVRSGTIFFRGTSYQLASGDNPNSAVRSTLAQLLPSIYPRFADLTHRVANEESAVKAALSGNTTNPDLQALGVYKSDGTLNDSHPLLSTLRGRLPLAEQDLAPVSADALRNELERPPFGWDGNAVKVGLALLLRSSACRLIESSRTISDPNDADAAQALAKETRFKGLRVQGVRSDLGMAELQQIRGHIEAIFGIKASLVAATMNNVLGEKLSGMARQARELEAWASTAGCPLPLDFESGTSLVNELLNTAAPAVRLPLFAEQTAKLQSYSDLLQRLEAFQREQAAIFREVRDFFNSMVNAETDLAQVHSFITDWRTLNRERSVTEPARWSELLQVYHAARQAVTDQIVGYQQQANSRLEELRTSLPERVSAAGMPEEEMDAEVDALQDLFKGVRESLAQPAPSLYEMRGLLSALTNAELNLQRRLSDLRYRYRPVVVVPTEEVRVTWQELLGRMTISSPEELEQLLSGLRTRIRADLERQRTVIIE